MRLSLRRAGAVLFYLLVIASVSADTIQLRDGSLIYGKVVYQDQEIIRLHSGEDLISIQKSNIKRVEYNSLREPPEEESETKPTNPPFDDAEISRKIREKTKKSETNRPPGEPNTEQRPTLPQSKDQENKNTIRENTKENTTVSRSPFAWSILGRSAVLPGWGQFYAGSPWKGTMFAVAFAGASYGIYETNRLYRFQGKELEKNDPLNLENAILADSGFVSQYPTIAQLSDPVYFYYYNQSYAGQRRKLERRYDQLRGAVAAAVLIYAANLIDAAFFNEPIALAPVNSERSITATSKISPPGSIAAPWSFRWQISIDW